MHIVYKYLFFFVHIFIPKFLTIALFVSYNKDAKVYPKMPPCAKKLNPSGRMRVINECKYAIKGVVANGKQS